MKNQWSMKMMAAAVAALVLGMGLAMAQTYRMIPLKTILPFALSTNAATTNADYSVAVQLPGPKTNFTVAITCIATGVAFTAEMIMEASSDGNHWETRPNLSGPFWSNTVVFPTTVSTTNIQINLKPLLEPRYIRIKGFAQTIAGTTNVYFTNLHLCYWQ